MTALRRFLASIVILAAVAIIAFLTVPPVRTAARTVGLLAELLELPARPLSAVTPAPKRITTSYSDPPDRLDLYYPADAQPADGRAAVVLSLGIHPSPLDHPDVMRIAGSMARLGLVVAVPDSTALRGSRVTAQESSRLADAVIVVRGLPGVDQGKVALAGFSAGASVALISAADPRIAGRLSFVSGFGAYADAETLLVDVATRTMEQGDQILPWSPELGIRRDVSAILIAAIDPSGERDRLTDVLRPTVESETPPSGPDPDVLHSFTERDVRAAYLLFGATSRADARAAIAGASDDVRVALAAVSPITVAGGIRDPIHLLHGQSDRSIPISHAHLIAGALPEGRLANLTIFSLFEHGQPGQEGFDLRDLPDVWQLYRYLHELVAAATE